MMNDQTKYTLKIELKKQLLGFLVQKEGQLKARLDEIMWERSGLELDIEQLQSKLSSSVQKKEDK